MHTEPHRKEHTVYDDEPTWRCYACGEMGHYARDCSARTATDPGPWPPNPPQYKRPSGPPKADARRWADMIRAQMGWERQPTAEEREAESLQKAARRQAAEARRERDGQAA